MDAEKQEEALSSQKDNGVPWIFSEVFFSRFYLLVFMLYEHEGYKINKKYLRIVYINYVRMMTKFFERNLV
ncbi:Uncharacterised protein [Campylobacter geochelonis]|nr:Uncharacterised protein [Campylobacter geochelonis]